VLMNANLRRTSSDDGGRRHDRDQPKPLSDLSGRTLQVRIGFLGADGTCRAIRVERRRISKTGR
jgi:hypothetical protein